MDALRDEPHEKQVERMREMCHEVYVFALFGLKIATMDKEQLVQKVREDYEEHGELLLQFPDAEKTASALLEFIKCGQARIAIAIATVEGPDDDPEGGEDIPE